MDDLYGRFRQLPRSSREALRASWPKREPRCRLDEAGVHPTWLTAHLEAEPAATLLVALGEIKRELGREVLRSLWPRVKSNRDDELEIRPLSPAWSGELRRWLFRSFVHTAPSLERSEPIDPLTALDAQQVWLLAQDLGREEIATLAAARPREIGALLQRLSSAHAAELGRWLGLESSESGPTDTMQLSSRTKSADRKELDSERFKVASEDVCVVLELSEGEANFLGSIGLRCLAAVLAAYPREQTRRIAQRMGLPLAQRLLAWRDEIEERGDFSATRNEEILRKLTALPGWADLRRRAISSEPHRDLGDGTETTSGSVRRELR